MNLDPVKNHWGRKDGKAKRCCYCEVLVPYGEVTRDHIIPKSKGGRLTQPCCKKCNREKRDMLLIDYVIKLLRDRKQMVREKPIKRCETKIKNAVEYMLLLYPGEYDFIFKTP